MKIGAMTSKISEPLLETRGDNQHLETDVASQGGENRFREMLVGEAEPDHEQRGLWLAQCGLKTRHHLQKWLFVGCREFRIAGVDDDGICDGWILHNASVVFAFPVE